jgi:hypothetical protein
MTAALTRLWWRLEDVLPLAEHAMACTVQARTAARTRAHAADRPALTWMSTGGMDLLTSTGEPGWHTATGQPQHAEAYTWQHRDGGYGTAWRDTYNTAHLPLTATGGRPAVIDTLRAARHTGHHWLALDIVPADGHLTARRLTVTDVPYPGRAELRRIDLDRLTVLTRDRNLLADGESITGVAWGPSPINTSSSTSTACGTVMLTVAKSPVALAQQVAPDGWLFFGWAHI